MQKSIFFLIPFLLLLLSCEEEYIPQDVFDKAEISVEGYIEYGDSALPPYVILTKSFPYTSTLSPEALNELFIHDAIVKVSDGTVEVQLTEICLNDILSFDSTLAEIIATSIGLGGVDLGTLNYCIYVDIGRFLGSSALVPTQGNSYYLTVINGEDTVRATTTIPPLIPLDSVFYVSHPDFPANDSLVEIRAKLRDFPNRADFYRIFTQRNREPMFALLGGSVTDDKIFDGREFEFPIQRGQPQTADFDVNTFGYFLRGDTVTVRSANLDYRHFRFWQTLEYNIGTQGPFTSYVRIESNINGGLGIWGGLSFGDYKLIIQ
jgi:hypothetical protein